MWIGSLNMNKKLEENFLENLKQVLKKSDKRFSINDVHELNLVLDHISNLIQDSYILYNNDSYNSSVCFSIIALEEISKAIIGNYQSYSGDKEGAICMLNKHKIKDKLATPPTIYVGKRLRDKIGESKILDLMNELQNSKMVHLRENSVYYSRANNTVKVPNISKEKARNLLLYVIEYFDDGLIGLTNFSYELEKKHNIIFDEL